MPEGALADPKPTLDCNHGFVAPSAFLVTGQTAGGVVMGPNLNVAFNLRLTESLVLESVGTLTVSSRIGVSDMAAADVSVTMIAIGGDVVIAPGAAVDLSHPTRQGDTDRSRVANASATGTAGINGGFIRIVAHQGSIRIDGPLTAGIGGEGGYAVAQGTASAAAVGAQGGFGGDVVLCAQDAIVVTAPVAAGGGGLGGTAIAKCSAGTPCSAKGGPGNDGGSVHFIGTDPNVTSVTLSARVTAGNGDDGGAGHASGGVTVAVGAPGGKGGTVTFTKCHVVSHVIVQAGNGGGGGNSTSIGAIGLAGADNATASGGNGGATGPAPTIPVFGLPPETGDVEGEGGKGGDAIATGGNIGGFAVGAGTGTATGGTGAATGVAPPPVTATPTATSMGTK